MTEPGREDGQPIDLGVADDHAGSGGRGHPRTDTDDAALGPSGVGVEPTGDLGDDGPVGGGPSGDEETEGVGGTVGGSDAGPAFEDRS